MVTIAVDDMLTIAQQIRNMMMQIDPEGMHFAMNGAAEAIASAKAHKPDIVWLDIDMPEMSGLELAAHIKKGSPDTNIVFVTGYSQYAVDAFGMHASGFVVKPVTAARLRDEIDNLRHPLVARPAGESLLRVQCFGNFEVFGPEGIVRFSRALSKEALAYLIDRRGAGCTVSEICSVLWEERVADKNLKSQARVVLGSLKKDLEAVGAGDVLVKNWNTWGVDTSKVSCDYYDFLKRDSAAVNSFRGEYMAQYPWAELTVGVLFDIMEGSE